jgi:hypothetical protein
MKKNVILLICFGIFIYSVNSNADTSWVPKYQKKRKGNIAKRDLTRAKIKNKSGIKDKVVTTQSKQKVIKATAAAKEDTKIQTMNVDTSDLDPEQKKLLDQYFIPAKKKVVRMKLKSDTINMAQKAVPVLTKVMKDSAFPENNRWMATFMLGRIMGRKSAPFIAKFSRHPHWMLRLASLKVLLALDQKKYLGIYGRALKDKALIVRHQALENINKMKLKNLAPHVWGMLYDESNYKGQKGDRKRTNIIRDVILTVGNLGFAKARKPMMTMIQNRKYKDIFGELDKSLSKLSSRPSPDGNITSKQYYWSREALKEKTI